MSSDQFLHGVRAVILEQGLGKARTGILRKRLKAKGGHLDQQLHPGSTTHLVVGPNVRRSRLPALLGGMEVPAEVRVVRADWLSGCLTHGALLREEEYTVPRESPQKLATSPSPSTSPAKSRQLRTGERGDDDANKGSKKVVKALEGYDESDNKAVKEEEKEEEGKGEEESGEPFPVKNVSKSLDTSRPVSTSTKSYHIYIHLLSFSSFHSAIHLFIPCYVYTTLASVPNLVSTLDHNE